MVNPLVGWAVGLSVRDLVAEVDHWIAFVLLVLVGGKMIYESFKIDSIEKRADVLKLSTLIILSLATSIDALIMGITFAILNISILLPILIIGLVTFFLSFIGVYIGDRLGHFFENKMEFVGGLVLIGIGIKILIEHLS